MSEVNQKLVSKKELSSVGVEKRQSWGSIAMIWTGSMICVSSLMTGGLLVSGLTVLQAFGAAAIGYGIVVLYMCFQGMQAADLGLPTVSAANSAFGEAGSRIIISFALGVACLGWFGFQANVCGSAFSGILATSLGISIPIWVSSLIWGFIMLVTAIYGFNALKYLNYIAVPALILASIYGVYAVLTKYGTEILSTYKPAQPMSFLAGIALTVGSFAVGGVIAGDYSRYAKDRRDVIKSSVFGVVPAGIAMITMGAIMSLVSGTYDITIVFSDLGIPALGLVTLVLATWTTNAVNAYSGGLAITKLFNLDDSKRSIATGVAGAIGTLLAVAGIINYFVNFLMILTAAIPPIAGVMIADYWIIKKGKAEEFNSKAGMNYIGVISWLAGSIVAILIKIGIQPINGILVSMILYYVLMKITSTNK